MSYRVRWLPSAIQVIREYTRKLRATGREIELIQAVRTLEMRLRTDPTGLGEVYRSRGVVDEHLAVQDFLAIDFAVDKQRMFVLVRVCNALSGRGL